MRLSATPDAAGTLLPVKVVPGASRSRIAGPHGDGVRAQVAAPAERGRANEALCELFAQALGLPRRAVTVVQGAGSPHKVLRIEGLSPDAVAARLASVTS